MHYNVTSHAKYSQVVEFGSRPHTIRAKKADVLAADTKNMRRVPTKYKVNKSGYVVFGREVQHPGTKPQPFFEPAIEKADKTASKDVKKHVDAVIVKSVRKNKNK